MPWSMNDNPIAWLEVTDICNIHCEGCYRQKISGHKTLDQIKEEILFFKKWRNPDNVSIAGGEPLIHPQIVDIVASIKQAGIKPVVLTNGRALTPELLRELKKAGLFGFTIHIDSHQNRPEWGNKTEKDLNQLRQHFADMVAEVGGISVLFNSTIYPSTLKEVPDIVTWAQSNIGKVHGVVFITYRTAIEEKSLATDKTGKEIDLNQLSYTVNSFDQKFVTSPEVMEMIKTVCPVYQPSGYLGGTVVHSSFKWLDGAVIGSHRKIYGSIGKRSMEVSQVGHHFFKGTYLAYISGYRAGVALFLAQTFDSTLRKAWSNWCKDVLRNPLRLF